MADCPRLSLDMLQFVLGEKGFTSRSRFASRHPKTHEGGRRVHPREADVADVLVEVIREREGAPKVKRVPWETEAAPTDYGELFKFTAWALAKIRRENPKAKLVVNLSPGTPAMQPVMLLALQARLAGENFQAFHGTPQDKRRTPDEVMREVPWNLLAELAAMEIEGAASTTPSSGAIRTC